jgi:hypothetical protein
MAVVLSREEWESEKIFLESFVEWYEPHFLEKLDELARKSGEYFVLDRVGVNRMGWQELHSFLSNVPAIAIKRDLTYPRLICFGANVQDTLESLKKLVGQRIS